MNVACGKSAFIIIIVISSYFLPTSFFAKIIAQSETSQFQIVTISLLNVKYYKK